MQSDCRNACNLLDLSGNSLMFEVLNIGGKRNDDARHSAPCSSAVCSRHVQMVAHAAVMSDLVSLRGEK